MFGGATEGVPPQCRDAPWGVSRGGESVVPPARHRPGRTRVFGTASSASETPHGASLHWDHGVAFRASLIIRCKRAYRRLGLTVREGLEGCSPNVETPRWASPAAGNALRPRRTPPRARQGLLQRLLRLGEAPRGGSA